MTLVGVAGPVERAVEVKQLSAVWLPPRAVVARSA